MQNRNSLGLQNADSYSEQISNGILTITQPAAADVTPAPCKLELLSNGDPSSCSICSGLKTNLCARVQQKLDAADAFAKVTMIESTVQVVPPRRSIYHPKEWSEFIPVICQGWAASSLTLADGRRQILSFVLPGDLVSTAGFLEPMSGRTVEALTEVTYRNFKRSALKAFLLGHPELLEALSRTLVEDRMEADQLALDLGRRPADERIARLILKLAKRLAPRGMMDGKTMEFPLRQRHIADATGLTPVHVSKMMGEFQHAELIRIGGRTLTIVNEPELCRIADWR